MAHSVQAKLDVLAAIRGTAFVPLDGGSYSGTAPVDFLLNGDHGSMTSTAALAMTSLMEATATTEFRPRGARQLGWRRRQRPLIGGSGNDLLIGGSGIDTAIWNEPRRAHA